MLDALFIVTAHERSGWQIRLWKEDAEDRESPVARTLSNQPPLRALQYRLMSFLKQSMKMP